MPIVRRIKKIESTGPSTFDEQLWPINVALLLLAGFVAGCVVALSRFDDQRLLYNGWVRLATLGLSVGLLLWGINYLPNRRWRRSMQLAVVLSWLFHVMLMVVLYNQRMAYLAQREAETDNAAVPEQVLLPDYHVQAPDAAPQDFEQPVETEHPPDPTETQPEIKHEVPHPEEKPTESQPTPVPGATPEVEPSMVKLNESEQAAPRRSDQASALSRQTVKVTSPSQAQVSAPADRPQEEPTRQIDAQAKPLERQAATPAAQSPQETPEPVRAPQQQSTQLARRETADPSRLDSSQPTLERRVREPSATPRGAAQAPAAETSAQRTAPLEPTPVVARREAEAPKAALTPAPEPKPAAAPQAAALDVARADRSERPQVTDAPQKLVSRAAESAQTPAPAPVKAPQPTAAASDAAGGVTPAAAPLARSDAQAPQAGSAPSGGETAAPTPSPAASGAIAKVEAAVEPSLNPAAPLSRSVARAATPSAVEASPAQLESPAAAEAPSGSQPQVAPSPAALAKGSAGVIGGGQEANFDRGLAASDQPAPVASMAASRPTNLQSGPEGPALAPSAPAAISKSVASANVPQAKVASDDATVPDMVGSARPGPIEASSSAALRKAEGRGQPSAVSAAAGSGQIDTGPTQIVASAGTGRAAGGGGPTVQLNTQLNQLARSSRGGAPVAALAAPVAAPMPEAPAGEGGGAPAATPGPTPVASAARAAGEAGLPATSPGSGAAGAGSPGAGLPAGAEGPAALTSAPASRVAESSEVAPGVAQGGGSKIPSRTFANTMVAEVKADAPQLPAGPAQGESPGGAPEPAGTAQAPVRSAAGLPTASPQGPPGAAEGPAAVDSALAGAPGLGTGPAAASAAGEPSLAVGNVAAAGPLRKVNVAGVPGGTATAIDAPQSTAAAGPAGTAQAGEPSAAPTDSTGRRAGSLPVQIAALEGPGGLGAEVTLEAGSLSRRAQRESEVIHAGKERFIGRTLGGPLAVDGKAREPARAFSRRGGQRLTKSGHPEQPLERTEATIELGLDFLARHQSADGSWSLNHFGAGRPGYEKEQAAIVSDTAATGLALLAFLGAGYDHYDDQYQNIVRGGLEYLLRVQKPNGDLYVAADPESNKSAWLYSHGIASIALCEAFGMTGDANLREPAQKAIDFIVAAQHPTRGGWRYVPQFDSDTSVSGWQLMALKSGELAGLSIAPGTYDKVRRWLDGAQASPRDSSQYVYNPNNPANQPQGRRPTTTMTAVGLLMRMYTGWNRNDPRMIQAARTLLANLPEIGTAAAPKRDTYYWYYATQVMFHMKGPYWQAWHERLHPLLVDRQIRTGAMAGSWDPLGQVPDRWGTRGGRLYVTTLNLLSLEVAYRHLPIYESEAK